MWALSEIELVEPRSPTHTAYNTQGLNDAVRYAGQVTSRRRALRNAREYAAHVTTTAFQEAARRMDEATSTAAQSSDRYQDSRRSQADSDIPAASSQANSTAPRTGFLNLASRQPCQPTASSEDSSRQSTPSSSDSIVRNVLLPDFSGPTAVSSANTMRRTNSQTRPPASGSSLLRSRLCASAASSSSPPTPESVTNASGAAVTSTAGMTSVFGVDVAVSSGASATVTDVAVITTASITTTHAMGATVTSGDNVTPSQTLPSEPASIPATSRPSLLRSFLSVPSVTSAPVSSTISSISDSTPSTTQAASSSAPLVIFGSNETSSSTPASNESSTAGIFNFTQNLSTTPSTVNNSDGINTGSTRPQPHSSGAERRGNNQADETSPGSPELGSSCPDQCNICSGMPGVRESFAMHRMRNRRRRMIMRNSVMGRRSMRRTGNPPVASSSAEHPPRERTQTLASYIDSEVRRVLGQQNSQESDSSDSTTERNDTYQQPTALIMQPSTPHTAPSVTPVTGATSTSANSMVERRRQLYERLRNDVREMESDMRDLRNVLRQRQIEMRMQNLARYRQRREDRQRRIDERLHLSALTGSQAGRGRTGPRLSRFHQNLGMRAAERQRRSRLHVEELRAG